LVADEVMTKTLASPLFSYWCIVTKDLGHQRHSEIYSQNIKNNTQSLLNNNTVTITNATNSKALI